MSYKDDVRNKRILLRKQQREILPDGNQIMLTCECGKRLSIFHAYKCYFCRLWMCWTCAGYHFKKKDIR